MRAAFPRHGQPLFDRQHRAGTPAGGAGARAGRQAAPARVRGLALRQAVSAAALVKRDAIVRLALEMAAHEESERRAFEGELALLEDAWREAEEIAAIADRLLVPESIENWIRQQKEKLVSRRQE